MRKYVRQHLKKEKRLLKLMYRKGVIHDLIPDFGSLMWEYLRPGKRLRKRKSNGRKYSFTTYLPELHVFSCDYWGECDSRSVIELYQEVVYWSETEMDFSPETGLREVTSKVDLSYEGLTKRLKAMPTVFNDSKFNKFLRVSQEE